MNPNKLMLALALVLSSQHALADDCNAQGPVAIQQENQEDVATALALLIESGVIKVEDGKIVVTQPSALEKLRQEGRLKVEAASYGSICF
jgi:hypothetical protein